MPEINDAVMDASTNANGNVIITVGHASDLKMAQKSLTGAAIHSSTPIDFWVASSPIDLFDNKESSQSTTTSIPLLPVDTTYADMYKQIVEQTQSGSTVYVFESSWHALEQGISLFGDYIPRGGSGMALTTFGEDKKLCLNFPKWSSILSPTSSSGVAVAKNGDIAQQNEAMMNPWTNLVSEQEFAELLSARIVPFSSS